MEVNAADLLLLDSGRAAVRNFSSAAEDVLGICVVSHNQHIIIVLCVLAVIAHCIFLCLALFTNGLLVAFSRIVAVAPAGRVIDCEYLSEVI